MMSPKTNVLGLVITSILLIIGFAILHKPDKVAKAQSVEDTRVVFFAITPTMKFNCLDYTIGASSLLLKKCKDLAKADLMVADYNKNYQCSNGLCREL
jgi:hypothetical protein